MPPLDALNSMKAMSIREDLMVTLVDVKKAHLSGVVKPEDESHYAQALEERRVPGKCWKLKKWLCGSRPAETRACEEAYTEKLETLGTRRRKAAPTYFFDELSRTRASVHSDDFMVAGPKMGVEREWFEVKVRFVLGREADDDKDIVVLGRMVRWTQDDVELEADERPRWSGRRPTRTGAPRS